jgi:class 3 adenylate cyclase/predicted ATPase
MDVADWLRALGLEQYEATFRENDVDAELLLNLAADDLKELGITSFGHRRRLLEAIAALRTNDPPTDAPARLPTSITTGNLGSPGTAAERRPLSVMFCDLIGSTALSARLDPEDLREVIRAYQACVVATIQQFDGFIARYVGDGVLIYFGWPEARETDAERAVRAALAVAAAVSASPLAGEPLQVRIGIATGLVVVGEPIGSGDSRQQTAVGETPNLAARLQGLAGPGQVVIDAATRRQIGGLFECRDLGAIELKGLPAAVPSWHVLSENRAIGQFEALRSGTTPLVGRDEEMELLLRRWAQAKVGNGRVVLISAEPGGGKSRLAAALAERIVDEPHIRLRYFCSPHHQDSALYPVIAQMERAAGFAHADGPAGRLVKLQALLAATTPPMEDVALIAELHSLPSGDLSPPLDLTPQRKKDKTFEALLRQVEGLSRQQPVLMIFDDLHWIDPSSRELLDRTAERVAEWPVLLLAMFRPEFQPPWTGQPHVTTLTLSRLDRRNTVAMVANVAGNAALTTEIMEEIAERTDGVPLFVEELTRAVLEAGAQVSAALSSVPHPALSVPATLHASLIARLDRLGPAARDVAQSGAAIGREFGYGLLATTTDLPEPQLREGLDRLTNASLLFVHGTPPQSSYTFKHALVQDAAYGTLLRSRRQLLHARIAAALEDRFPEVVVAQPALLAQHCAEAGLAEKAVSYWLTAGQQARARSAMLEAVAQMRKALSLIGSLPDNTGRWQRELDLQIVFGAALIATQGYGAPMVGETYTRARHLCELLDEPLQLASVLYGQWTHHLIRAELEPAQRFAAEMRHLADTRKDSAMQWLGCFLSGVTYLSLGKFGEARAYFEQGVALFDPAQRPLYAPSAAGNVVPVIYLSATLAPLGYLDRAEQRREAALGEARLLKHVHTLTVALNTAAVGDWSGHLEPTALQRADELVTLSAKHGYDYYRATGTVMRGWCLATLGHLEEGLSLVRQGVDAYRATGAMLLMPFWLMLFADADGKALRPEDGLERLTEATNLVEATQVRWHEAGLYRVRGELLVAMHQPAAAEDSFRKAIAVAQHQSAKLWELHASVCLARLWRDQGKRAEARDLLAPIYHWFTEGFDTPDLKDAKALLDDLA